MNDLFGQPILGELRKGKRNETPRGYAAPPGTGPANETCRTCAHARYVQYSKRYWKCGLLERVWTGGFGTDIRLKSPACLYWKAKEATIRET